MSIRISIFGLGYVGSVTAACLAQLGHYVIGVDSNPRKVEAIVRGLAPVVEPDLQELIAESANRSRLQATSDARDAILDTDISFISVATPGLRNGKLDLSSIECVCRQIGETLRIKPTFHWVVLRSTVLPGTTRSFVTAILESVSGKQAGTDFGVCFNPEFLREGTAIHDFYHPPFTVLGTVGDKSCAQLREIYSWLPVPLHETDATTAEMVKYVCNAFHALKVAFANEVGTLCLELSAEVQRVTEIFTSDDKLNLSPAYLRPGFAFGGSCLPKDLRALNYRAKELDLNLPLLNSILPSNHQHIERAADQVLRTGKKRVGLLGLSFKSGTDDLRESPMVHLVKRLLGEGCQCRIWDRTVRVGQLLGSNQQFIEQTIPHVAALLHDDVEEVLSCAEVVVLGTREIDKCSILAQLRSDQILVDLLDLASAQQARNGVSPPACESLPQAVRF